MENLKKAFGYIEQAISADASHRLQSMRGAAVVDSTDYSDRPLLAIYGYKLDNKGDLQEEMELVRAELPEMGVHEFLSLVISESYYCLIVVPDESLDSKYSSDDLAQLTDYRILQIYLLLKDLNSIAWDAWHMAHETLLFNMFKSEFDQPDKQSEQAKQAAQKMSQPLSEDDSELESGVEGQFPRLSNNEITPGEHHHDDEGSLPPVA